MDETDLDPVDPRPAVPRADAPGFSERRERMLDDLADALEACVDLPALLAAARGATGP